MAIETISLINIIGKITSLDKTLTKIAKSEMFHIEETKPTSKIKDFKKLNEKNPYSGMLEKINKIFKMLEILPHFNDYSSINFKKNEEIKQLIDKSFATLDEKTKLTAKLKSKISIIEKSLKQLSNIKLFSFELYKIFSANFISSCFIRVTCTNYLKLIHFNNINFFFIPLKHDKNFHWGLFIYPTTEQQQFQKMAKALFFEQFYSSEQVEKNPKLTIKKMKTELKALKNRIESLNQEIENYKLKHAQNLLCIYSKIKTLHTTFLLRQSIISNNNLFYINGFVLEKNLNCFIDLFDDIDDVVVENLSTKNKTRKNFQIPVKLKTNPIFKPFELLIETFGLPSYGTTNPTTFVGFIYCFLFGLMFGDIGQGACLFIAGTIVWLWKKNVLGLILTRCAVSSCIFGLIYDSCFGFEGLFKGFWKSFKIFSNMPFNLLKGKNAVTILIISLILGMILINIAILKNILINLKNKKYRQAIISGNGITGLLIYSSITFEAISILVFKENILNPILLIFTVFIPITLIFLEKPIFDFINIKIFKKYHKTKFNFLNSALETFETILNYFTNTLSFLRVGGFAMSHAALMLVVVKFCEKCSNIIASPLIAMFGNVFIIALEGMVVSIQVLRLIYYEIFSRFYDSNGKKFKPTKIIF